MSNKRKIQGLIAELHELEELLEGIAEYDSAPKVLFKLAINKSSKIITGLGTLSQDDSLRRMADMAVPPPLTTSVKLETLDEDTDSYPDLERVLRDKNAKNIQKEEPLVVLNDDEERTVLQTGFHNNESMDQEVNNAESEQIITHQKSVCNVSEEQNNEPKVLADELVQRRLATGLFKSLTLNDRFRFQRELFGNNPARLNSVLEELDRKHSLEEALAYIVDELSLDLEDEAVKDFIQILEKRFL